MKLSACGRTDIGRLRKSNQDIFLVDLQRGLFVVADGMGGHAAGEIASAMAGQVTSEQLSLQVLSQQQPADLTTTLEEAIRLANSSIAQAASDNPDWKGMGTTLTVLLLRDEQAFLGHVGDSRLYRWRAGKLEQLSEDHSLIADQLRRGLISPPEADTSDLRNILLQAVGITPDLDICRKQFPLAAGDRYLLCSDGLTGMLNDREIAALLERNLSPEQGCELLIEQALAAGGNDNVTAVLVQVEEP